MANNAVVRRPRTDAHHGALTQYRHGCRRKRCGARYERRSVRRAAAFHLRLQILVYFSTSADSKSWRSLP
jgi:hypothetical protein